MQDGRWALDPSSGLEGKGDVSFHLRVDVVALVLVLVWWWVMGDGE